MGPVQAPAFTHHLSFQVQIHAHKTLLYLCGAGLGARGGRGVRGEGKGRVLPLRPVSPGLCPCRAAGGSWEGSLRGLHPHAAVGHPGPEPALPVHGVLSRVLEPDEANAGPVVGESVGDLERGEEGSDTLRTNSPPAPTRFLSPRPSPTAGGPAPPTGRGSHQPRPSPPGPAPPPQRLPAHLDPASVVAVLRHGHLPAAELGQHVLVLRQQLHRELVQAAGVAAPRVPAGAGASGGLSRWAGLLQRVTTTTPHRAYRVSHFTDKETEVRERK